MASTINIKKGTRSDGHNLCDTCGFGFVAKGPAEAQEIHFCNHQSEMGKLTFPIVECTGYQSKGDLSIHQMEDIAFVLMPKKGSGKMGFYSPEERRKREREDMLAI